MSFSTIGITFSFIDEKVFTILFFILKKTSTILFLNSTNRLLTLLITGTKTSINLFLILETTILIAPVIEVNTVIEAFT